MDNIYTFVIELSEITLELFAMNATECRNGKTCTLADVIRLPYDERKLLSWHSLELDSGDTLYVIHFYLARQINLALEYYFETDNMEWFDVIRESYFRQIGILYGK